MTPCAGQGGTAMTMGMTYTVAALYRFTPLENLPELKARLLPQFAALGLCGSLLIAPEGINGTMAGSAQGIEGLLKVLNAEAGLTRDDVKFSYADEKPFLRLKIRLKKEIVTLRQPEADPTRRVGAYVEPSEWNALINQPDVVVLDTRNDYETRIGTFDHAVVPPIQTFTQFVDFVRTTMDPKKQKKVAMFCTGGIRCEKASAFMLAEGFEQVYHLKGGILKYLEVMPEESSLWHGDCYVFDRRMAVGHGLKPGAYTMCFNCGDPLSAADRASSDYEEGVSCPRCNARTSESDKQRFRMRHQQMTAGDVQRF